MSELRCVFDTSATISALLFEFSTPGQAFYAAVEQGEILHSTATFMELCGVLRRPKFNRYVTPEQREQFLLKLLLQSRLIDIEMEIHECRDPKDNKFLELAVCGKANSIVSGDADLLVLHPFREIPIITPAQFLDSLVGESEEPN